MPGLINAIEDGQIGLEFVMPWGKTGLNSSMLIARPELDNAPGETHVMDLGRSELINARGSALDLSMTLRLDRPVIFLVARQAWN